MRCSLGPVGMLVWRDLGKAARVCYMLADRAWLAGAASDAAGHRRG